MQSYWGSLNRPNWGVQTPNASPPAVLSNACIAACSGSKVHSVCCDDVTNANSDTEHYEIETSVCISVRSNPSMNHDTKKYWSITASDAHPNRTPKSTRHTRGNCTVLYNRSAAPTYSKAKCNAIASLTSGCACKLIAPAATTTARSSCHE